jgi:WS/DGAT/MGAT family acyltransferase
MTEPYYDRLTQLDNSFLIYEDAGPAAAMHVASTQIHEAEPLQRADGSLELERIEEYVLSRLDQIPRYRQRIHRTPFEGHPVWVDDAAFNIHYHVRHTRLPHPGSERQLKRLAGRIFSQRLDREKPLWELWVIEGLEDNRLAFFSKVHHCMVDGVSGSELLAALLSPTPQEKPEPPPHWTPRPIPSDLKLGAGEVARVVNAPISLGSAVGRLVRDEDHSRHQLAERMRAVRRVFSDSGGTTPVAFNRPVGPHRRIDWVTLPIDEIKRLGRSLGATLNDVVLATAAGAFGRFLSLDRGMDLEDLRFRVLAPVSVRREDQHGALGNQVSAWTVDLPIAELDPKARVESIRQETAELKESHAALGAESIGKVTEWTGAGLLSLTARLVSAGTPFNTVVTNVPGPQIPLYFLESRLLAIHPHVPLMGTMGIGIALFSYDGLLSWGLSGDWDLVPDLHQLAGAIEDAFEELRAAVA